MDPEKKMAELEEQALKIIELARKKGAQRVYVSATYGNNSSISYEKNDFNLATSHEGAGFGLTVHVNQKSGSASMNRLDPESVEATVSDAIGMAKYSIPDEYLAMAKAAEYPVLPCMFDPAIADMGMGELRELAVRMIAVARKDPRVSLDGANLDRGVGMRVIANSQGMLARDTSSSLGWSLMGMAIDGEDITSFDHRSDFSYASKGSGEKIEATAKDLAEHLLECLGARKGVSYRGQVLLPPSLVEELLVDPLIYHILGGNIMDGKSRWAEAIGEKIAFEGYTLEDHPHDVRMRGCTPFSREGVPTRKMSLVEKGILKQQLDSVYSAKKRGTAPTGNGGGPHVPVLGAGRTPLAKLKASGSRLLDCGRFSGNLDSITGDFSGVIKGGHLYENGQSRGPVKEVMIAGNVFEGLLANPVFSAERETDGGSFLLPYALLDGVSVTASS